MQSVVDAAGKAGAGGVGHQVKRLKHETDEHELDRQFNNSENGALRSSARESGRPVQARVRVLEHQEHPLHESLIPHSIRSVLRGLHRAGYEAYLVGGCVRDLYLEKTPKDFDVLSTAEPQQVKRAFPGRAYIVGRRFRICHVRTQDSVVEVSSFSTESLLAQKQQGGSSEEETPPLPTVPTVPQAGPKGRAWSPRDMARWENALKRDFTINALLYDPFKRVLYDYVGGTRDLKQGKVRAIAPAHESFALDPARYLRAIRVAARLGLSFDAAVARCLDGSLPEVAGISKAKQLHAMKLSRRAKKSTFFFKLMRSLDLEAAPDRPCPGPLWTLVLALALAAERCNSKPVAIASLAIAVNDRKGCHSAAHKATKIHNHSLRGPRGGPLEPAEEGARAEMVLLLWAHPPPAPPPPAAAAVLQVVIPRSYVAKATTMLKLVDGGPLDAHMVEAANGARNAKGRFRSLGFRESYDEADDEIRSMAWLYTKIVLNTLYPKTS
eukprot:jgi/Mesen1/10887/ME000935S10229